jgi:outer membrane protein with glycine zipper
MRRSTVMTAAMLLPVLLIAAAPGESQAPPSSQTLGVFVYPAKGQSPAQQQAEESECYGWAHKQTGIDPTAPPKAAPPPQQTGPDGSALKGAAGGAAVGTAIGAIAGDTGEGAAIGAVAGAVRGRRMAKKKKQQQAQQSQQQAQAETAYVQETFRKAYGACLEGKGYTVK